ncbi:MAG TPA: sugar ABC transporter permease [Acetobacteraceae bacterium]
MNALAGTADGLGPPQDPSIALSSQQDRQSLHWTSLLLLTPATLLLLLLFLGPLAYAFYLGFTNMELIGPRSQHYSFTGAANILRMMQDHTLHKSLWLTLIFLVGSAIIGQSVLGMVLALLMQPAIRLVRISVGAIIIVAWVVPEVAAALMWYAFAQSGGTLGLLLGQPNTDFLSTHPLLIVSVANLWRHVAFSMLMFAAALSNLPPDVLEAAEIEGASAWRRLISIKLPIMRPTIVTNLLLVTISNLSTFTLIYVMTQGGPGTDTTTLAIYVYLQAFSFNQLGYGTAVALLLVAIGAAFSMLFVHNARVTP